MFPISEAREGAEIAAMEGSLEAKTVYVDCVSSMRLGRVELRCE